MSFISSAIVRVGAVAILVASGCAAPTDPRTHVRVAPTASEFARSPLGVAEVTYAVRNVGSLAVLLTSRCGDVLAPVLERRDSGRWQLHASGFCLANVDMSPIALGPGASRLEVAIVGAAGEYRLVIGTEHGPVASPAFVVR